MVEPITVSNLTQTGRAGAADKKRDRVKLTYPANFSTAADISFNFNNQEVETFGTVQAVYIDNGTNPNPIILTVNTTQFKIVVPALSVGYYNIDTTSGATVRLQTDGGASAINSPVVFYNYTVPPQIYYAFGAFNSQLALRMQGGMSEGDNIPAQTANDPVYIGGKDGSNTLRGIRTDANGRLEVVGAAAGGTVYGPDAVGVAPTQNPLVIAGVDGGGLIRRLLTSVAGYLQVQIFGYDGTTDRRILTSADGVIQVDQKNAVTYARGPVPSSATSVTLIPANPARRSAKIFNDSSSTLYIGFGAVAVTNVSYSLQIAPGGYYEIPAQDSASEIRGFWSSVNGSAFITTGV